MKKNILVLGLVFTILGGVAYTEKQRKKGTIPSQVNVLKTVEQRHISTVDPAICRSEENLRAVSKVYEGLLEYHYLKRPLELIPNLADTMPTITDDKLTYTFTIKKGVYFQDDVCFPDGKGRELTAADFVYTIKRIADPQNKCTYFRFFRKIIVGLNIFHQECLNNKTTNYNSDIEGVQALDKHTLQFQLNKPCAQFLKFLAMPCCYVVAKEAVDYYGEKFEIHPVGTGPFITKDLALQSRRVTFYRNPTFRTKLFPTEASPAYKHMLKYGGRQLPLLDKIVTHIIPMEQARWLQFQSGKTDILDMYNSSIRLEVITKKGKLKKTLQAKGIQLSNTVGKTVELITLSNNNSILCNNAHLKKAMSMAFDRKKYNSLFYNNTATIAQSILPPGIIGYNRNYKNPYNYNLKKAKAYLEKAGFPNGKGLPVITLNINKNKYRSTRFDNKARFFVTCMRKIGIRIKLVSNDINKLLEKIEAKNATVMHFTSWRASYPDATSLFDILYCNKLAGVKLSDSILNESYEKLYQNDSFSSKKELYEKVNERVGNALPMIYTVHSPRQVIYQGWVNNYVYDNSIFCPEQYIAVDQTVKKQLMREIFHR